MTHAAKPIESELFHRLAYEILRQGVLVQIRTVGKGRTAWMSREGSLGRLYDKGDLGAVCGR